MIFHFVQNEDGYVKIDGENSQKKRKGQFTNKVTNYGVSYRVITSYLLRPDRGVQELSSAPKTVKIGQELMEKRRE
jgi:hypothetical protein